MAAKKGFNMRFKYIIAICLGFIATTALAIDTAADANATLPILTQKFITFSDIHFDPFVSCRIMAITPCPLIAKLQKAPVSQWHEIFESSDHSAPAFGRDANYALLKSTLTQLSAVSAQEKPRFALYLGDSLAHNFHSQYALYSHDLTEQGYETFVEKTFQFITNEIRQALPQIDIYPTLGNNDCYEDYKVMPFGRLLDQQAKIFTPLFIDESNQKSFTRTFSQEGYYSVIVPGNANQRIIVLDTVLFSRHIGARNIKQSANHQLTWFHQQLVDAKAANQSVILAMHIPPGVDVFATLRDLLKNIVPFWDEKIAAQFDNDLKEFASTIKIILPGHIHRDNFQVMAATKEDEVPISFTGSISPIYENNPGFKVYTYDPANFEIKNYDTYYYPMSGAAANAQTEAPAWKKEYNFNQIYSSNCLYCNITKGMNTLTPRGDAANSFKLYYVASAEKQLISIDHDWEPYYWCDIHSVRARDYAGCIKSMISL